jgi:hypothetical protein
MCATISSLILSYAAIYRCPARHFDRKYIPLRCMLDLGSQSFVTSPQASKAFAVPVVKREIPVRAPDIGGMKNTTEGLFSILFHL